MMTQFYRWRCLAFGVVAIVGVALGISGCASAEAEAECAEDYDCAFAYMCNAGVCEPVPPTRDLEPECTTNAGCAFGEQCNTAIGKCVPRTNSNNGANNGAPDAGDDDADNDAPDVDDPNICDPACAAGRHCEENVCVPDVDDPNVCEPACPAGRHCENNVCVDDFDDPNVCEPTCPAGRHCENNVCVDDAPTGCTQQDQSCDPATRDQGMFWCMPLQGGGGICANKCQDALTPTGCSRGEYCLNLGSDAQPVLGCWTSECSTDAECGQEICEVFQNEFGICVPPDQGGAGQEGEVCDVAATTNPCASGLYCVEESPGHAVCRSACTFWTPNNCPAGQVCEIIAGFDGVCTASLDPNTTAIFDICSPSYRMCGYVDFGNGVHRGVDCLPNNAGTRSCFMYCRSEMDCNAIEPAFTNYTCYFGAFPNAPSVGVCTG
jgi:hypothetical protein